ncbi:MAG: hypothetical protein P8106_04360 [Gammaproteobacteria bacterium]|jgi:hypothetical protein
MHVTRDMGYGLAEFAALLPRVFADWRIEGHAHGPWRLTSPDEAVAVTIEAEPRPPRRLGALTIPVLAVRFHDCTAGEAGHWQRFQQRFERGFHRGGG